MQNIDQWDNPILNEMGKGGGYFNIHQDTTNYVVARAF